MAKGFFGLRAGLGLLLALFALGAGRVAAEPPSLLLAERYRADAPLGAYWVSEKLDGVRAYWDGKQLRFRSGRPIKAPAWFVAAFPERPLDGELWLGRGRFDSLSGTVRHETPDDAAWRQIRYMLFELPEAPGPFSDRVAALRALVAGVGAPWLEVIEQQPVASHAELDGLLARVVAAGGEGLILHRADAPYVTGRSDVLLKLAPWQDAEAIVVAHLPGKGHHAGQTGALLVERPDGVRFAVGSGLTDALRAQPPAMGTRVTYRFRELTPDGLPRFPRFLRVRLPE